MTIANELTPDEGETGQNLTENSDPHAGAVDAQALAAAILTKCASGGDVSADFAALQMLGNQDMEEYLATALAEHIAFLQEAHHWMTLSRISGDDMYMRILRIARERVTGRDRLIVGTKLADMLRRKGGAASINEANVILTRDVNECVEQGPEDKRACGTAFYAWSFIKDELAQNPDNDLNKNKQLREASITLLERAAEHSDKGGDHTGAAQAKTRKCGVLLDNNMGDPIDILQELEEIVEQLRPAKDTWGERFFRNAVGRRAEAAARSHDPKWGFYYEELIGLPGIELHYGGKDAFEEWKAKYNPFIPRERDELATEQ